MKIVLIALDSLRKDRVSPYNKSIDFTSNLEELSDQSIVYNNAIAQSCWSLPSHVSVLTGKYPWQHRSTQKKPFVDDDIKLISEELRDKGYITSAVHNNTWLIPITGAMRGFDELHTLQNQTKYLKNAWSRLQSSKLLRMLRKKLILFQSKMNLKKTIGEETDFSNQLDKTKNFLEKNKNTDDFFLYVNLVSCHYPYNPPEKYKEKHNVKKDINDLSSRPLEYGGEIKDQEKEELNKLYNAEVDFLDHNLGKIIEKFKEEDIYDESLIIVFSDHGELLGEQNKFGHHFSTHKHLINVPLIIKNPDNRSCRVEDVTELREIYYKVLNNAGIELKDSNKFVKGAACGMYEEPVIYDAKISGNGKNICNSSFYMGTKNKIYRSENQLEFIDKIHSKLAPDQISSSELLNLLKIR